MWFAGGLTITSGGIIARQGRYDAEGAIEYGDLSRVHPDVPSAREIRREKRDGLFEPIRSRRHDCRSRANRPWSVARTMGARSARRIVELPGNRLRPRYALQILEAESLPLLTPVELEQQLGPLLDLRAEKHAEFGLWNVLVTG
jgi:hypothetical protein